MGTPLVSLLLPVHGGVAAQFLAEALDSVRAQTRCPDEVVISVDGPLSPDHEAVLRRYPRAEVVRHARNRGAGLAAAAGLAACRGVYVVRADSDDINEPTRIERQLALLESSGADVCATSMVEFETAGKVLGVRHTVVEHDEFARLMPSRNPVHQPTVVFRRTAAEAAGGYQHLPFLEDYDLWARMLADGARFVGLRDPLVRFRLDGVQARRTSAVVRRSERELQRRLVSYGVVSPGRARWNLLVRGAYRRLPTPVLERVYGAMFRRPGGDGSGQA